MFNTYMDRIVDILERLKKDTRYMVLPAADKVVEIYGRDPFLILVSCILSLRTKDTVSFPASVRLFSLAKTPKEFIALPVELIATTIYPVCFYRQKALRIHAISMRLVYEFDSIVPQSEHVLLSFPGVGRKTMNLVRGIAFGIPALCVDTHVHKVANRLGWVTTKKPEQTEQALKKIVPPEYWISLNTLLVMWGQNICTPVSPRCSSCLINNLCPKIGVIKSR